MQRNGGTAAGGGGGAVVNIASGCSSFIAQPAFVPYSTTKGGVCQMRRDCRRHADQDNSGAAARSAVWGACRLVCTMGQALLRDRAGAIIQMTRCSALDAAKWGIRVNAVCPGPILTDGTKRHARMLGVTLEEACREMTSRQIIPRSALAACLSEAHRGMYHHSVQNKLWCRQLQLIELRTPGLQYTISVGFQFTQDGHRGGGGRSRRVSGV